MKQIGFIVSRIFKMLIWSGSYKSKTTWDQRVIAYHKLDEAWLQTLLGWLFVCLLIIAVLIALL